MKAVELALGVVLPTPAIAPGLVEGALVEQALDPLADGQPAAGVLALDPLGAAELAGERLAAAKLVDLRPPSSPAEHIRGRRAVGLGLSGSGDTH